MEYLVQSHVRIKVLYDGIATPGELRDTTVRGLYSRATTTTTAVIWIKSPFLFLLLPDDIVI